MSSYKLTPTVHSRLHAEAEVRRGMQDAGLPQHVELGEHEHRLRHLLSSGRYVVKAHPSRQEVGNFDLHIHPKVVGKHIARHGHIYYDTRIAQLVDHHYLPGAKTVVPKPLSHLHEHIPAVTDYQHLFRGMSHDELHRALKEGHFRSHDPNVTGLMRPGHTWYSFSPGTASSYAEESPLGHGPVFHKPAYVIKIKKPEHAIIRSDRGGDDVEVPGDLPVHNVKGIFKGRVYAMRPGFVGLHHHLEGGKPVYSEGGNTVHPHTSVVWEHLR